MPPVSTLLRAASATLESVAEARTLLAAAMEVEPKHILSGAGPTPSQLRVFDHMVARRTAGEPLQHIVGKAYFRFVTLSVGPGVFIPRPETEALTGWVVEALRVRPAAPPITVVELCAGSGAISVALADEVPGLRQWAVEVDPAAFVYLARNTAPWPISLEFADMATALPELDGQVDVVVANPPYIPESRRGQLGPELAHDPDLALYSGADGLDAIRMVAEVARRLLRSGGVVACEHDDSHGESAPAVLTAAGFQAVYDHRDLTGRPRYVTAEQP